MGGRLAIGCCVNSRRKGLRNPKEVLMSSWFSRDPHTHTRSTAGSNERTTTVVEEGFKSAIRSLLCPYVRDYEPLRFCARPNSLRAFDGVIETKLLAYGMYGMPQVSRTRCRCVNAVRVTLFNFAQILRGRPVPHLGTALSLKNFPSGFPEFACCVGQMKPAKFREVSGELLPLLLLLLLLIIDRC